jgi:SAM-dependent methyltransferase
MFSFARSTPPDAARLARRLRRLAQVFKIDDIRRDGLDVQRVIEYYEQCHVAFRKYHSAEGAVHMALNDGDRFDPSGFYAPLRRLEATWPSQMPRDVLELGFGQGFNLADLGARHPQMRFSGIDLTPVHLALAERRVRELGLHNVSLKLGDFHQLPYAATGFDQAFAIEVFCHASDIERAFAEIARVLRPGGIFTLFDGYLTRPASQFTADEALAAELIAKGMAIDHLQCVDDIHAQARRSGFIPRGLTVLDTEVMPTLRRLERLTGAVIRIPWLGRRALAKRPPMRSRNVLAGYLMHTAVSMGLVGYRQIVLQKAA